MEWPLQPVSPVLTVEQDLALQWQLHETEWAQVLSCVSDWNTVQSRPQAQEGSCRKSPLTLLEVPMVLCNLMVLSSRFMKQVPKGSKIK